MVNSGGGVMHRSLTTVDDVHMKPLYFLLTLSVREHVDRIRWDLKGGSKVILRIDRARLGDDSNLCGWLVRSRRCWRGWRTIEEPDVVCEPKKAAGATISTVKNLKVEVVVVVDATVESGRWVPSWRF